MGGAKGIFSSVEKLSNTLITIVYTTSPGLRALKSLPNAIKIKPGNMVHFGIVDRESSAK